jgi:uncharacterized protein YbjT (DUF2867 family)
MRIAVTGAFGYSGRYIAQRLLEGGHTVITLTNSCERENPFGGRISAFPFHFDQPTRLRESLQGVDVLINTYWVRFTHPGFNHDEAVRNTRTLFQAAAEARVKRIIHLSITNPDIQSDLPYFRGKAELELALKGLGVSYCIMRPTVLFGKEDILLNNIAWSLRRFPIFGVFGAGDCKLQPIYVDDLASAVVEKCAGNTNEVVNAIGPETFTYRELVETVRQTLGLRRLVVSVPPELGYLACRLIELFVRDVVITRDEIRGLMENRLYVDAAPLGATRLTDWITRHRDTLGRRYTSELARRIDRKSSYRSN